MMFVDEAVEVREDLPEELLGAFRELKGYYDTGDWFQFDMLFEVVEARAKAYYLAGKISREDLNLIFKKYGVA